MMVIVFSVCCMVQKSLRNLSDNGWSLSLKRISNGASDLRIRDDWKKNELMNEKLNFETLK